MKYLLVLGFSCDTFKVQPLARILINQQLIDEFDIPTHFDTLTDAMIKEKWHSMSFVNKDKNVQKNCPPTRFYEIDIDKKLYALNIEIQIKNNDNNYNNGFMNASTTLQLQICHFFPMNQNLIERLMIIKRKNHLSENYAWYHSHKQKVFDLVANGMCWQGENGQKIVELAAYNIGGSGKFFIELTKKYNFFMPRLKFACRHTFNNSLLNHFLDKYQQYENKRNHN